MTDYEIGAVITLGLCCWLGWTEFRVRELQMLLAQAEERLKDAQIKDRVRHLSDAELDALLAKRLSGSENPKS